MTHPTTAEAGRRLVEAFAAAHDPAALAEDVIVRDQAQERSFRGRAAAGAFLDSLFREAFAGARSEVEAIVLGRAAAAIAFTFHGRHEGTFMGLPATRRKVRVPMVMVLQLASGLIARADLYYNAGTLLRQMELGA
jgi:steroid delta-isomerase-like uncharacterized protein